MKLLFCLKCSDAIGLRRGHLRECWCGASSGQYQDDNNTVEIGGPSITIGLNNFWMFNATLSLAKDNAAPYPDRMVLAWLQTPETCDNVTRVDGWHLGGDELATNWMKYQYTSWVLDRLDEGWDEEE